jgi:hypothetical protein
LSFGPGIRSGFRGFGIVRSKVNPHASSLNLLLADRRKQHPQEICVDKLVFV